MNMLYIVGIRETGKPNSKSGELAHHKVRRIRMKAKGKKAVIEEIWKRFPGMDTEVDIDWDMVEISFKAGEEKEYKKWVDAFMKAGILIAEVDTVGIAIDEAKRAGKMVVVEWVQNHGGSLDANRVEWQAFLKDMG